MSDGIPKYLRNQIAPGVERIRPLPCCLIWLCLTVGCERINGLEAYAEAVDKGPYDAIIVPGYPYRDGVINDIMKMRVLWSYHLYQKGLVKNIIYSGGAVYSPYYESAIMGQCAVLLGVPKDHIFMEKRARHGAENIFYSYQLAQDQGFEKVALATDPFQMKYLMRFRDKFDFDYDYLPVLIDSIRSMDQSLHVVGDSLAFDPYFESIESQSWLNRIRGTLGENIVEE